MTTKKTSQKTLTARALELGLVYQGQRGDHLTGIPARNLSPSEVAGISSKDLTACLKSNLYIIQATKGRERDQ